MWVMTLLSTQTGGADFNVKNSLRNISQERFLFTII